MPATNPIKSHLHEVKIKDLLAEIKQDKVEYLDSNEAVGRLIAIMKNKGMSAVPVVSNKQDKASCVGFIDNSDLVRFLVRAAPNDITDEKSLAIAHRVFLMVPVGNVCDMADEKMYTAHEDDTVSSVLAAMSEGHIHRVLVTNSASEFTGVLSQSDIVKYLSTRVHTGKMKAMGEAKLASFHYGEPSNLVTVNETATVLEALKVLDTKNVTCFAVVDGDNNLVGNFSASNLKGLYADNLPHLAQTVGDFLREHSAASLHPLSLPHDGTLHEVFELITNEGIHHLWAVEEGKPTGIFSCSDACRLINNWDSMSQSI